MRTLEIKLFGINELSEEAKEKAIEDFRYSDRDFPWMEELLDSMKAGLNHLGYSLRDWRFDYHNATNGYFDFHEDYQDEIGDISGDELVDFLNNNDTFYNSQFKTNYTNIFKDFGQCPFTGVYSDSEFLFPIKEYLDEPDPEKTLRELVSDCVLSVAKAIENEYEYQQSDEYIVEHFDINDYEFTEEGKVYY